MKTIAVVDDDAAVRCSTRALLVSAGYNVRLYAEGEAFLDDLRDDPNLVLLDVRMPGMNGIAVLRALQTRQQAPSVIVLTGHGDVDVAVQAMKLGALDFLVKPYNPEDLLERVEDARAIAERPRSHSPIDPSALSSIESLTPRQRDVLCGVARGKPSKVIAFELGLSIRTVEKHRAQLLERLEVHSTAQAIRLALLAGLGSDKESGPK